MQIEQIDIDNHFIRYITQNSDRLVVTFEAGGANYTRHNSARLGFGESLLTQAGYDLLVIMPIRLDWYQTPELADFFKGFARLGIFDDYQHVTSYGSSMGGFAALAYAGVIKAHQVLAISPRSILRNSVLSWPSAESAALDYPRNGPYSDAVSGLNAHQQIDILVDPFYERDIKHARRIMAAAPQSRMLRMPFMLHQIPQTLAAMRMLSATVLALLAGTFQAGQHYKALYARRDYDTYQTNLQTALANRQARRSTAR